MTNSEPVHAFSWTTAIVISVGVSLLAAGLSIFLQTHIRIARAFSPGDPAPALTTPVPAGVGTSYEKPGAPVRLIIPAIGVDAKIQRVGLTGQGAGDMGAPTNATDAGWYDGGPLPGMPGTAVIDGHLDGKDAEKAVFYDLGKLQPGDLVEVADRGGTVRRFRVTGSKTYDYDAPANDIFFGDVSKVRLNLITCAGDWIKSKRLYGKRIVVFTELITPN